MKLINRTPEEERPESYLIVNAGKGNPYRDMKTGQFDDAPFSKPMVGTGENRKKIDEAKSNKEAYSQLSQKRRQSEQLVEDVKHSADLLLEADHEGESVIEERYGETLSSIETAFLQDMSSLDSHADSIFKIAIDSNSPDVRHEAIKDLTSISDSLYNFDAGPNYNDILDNSKQVIDDKIKEINI